MDSNERLNWLIQSEQDLYQMEMKGNLLVLPIETKDYNFPPSCERIQDWRYRPLHPVSGTLADSTTRCGSLTDVFSHRLHSTGIWNDDSSHRLQHSTRTTKSAYFSYILQIRMKSTQPLMNVEDEKLKVSLQPIRDWEDSILLYVALVRLTLVSLVVKNEYVICLLNTLIPVFTMLYAVIIEVFLQCFTGSVNLRELGNSVTRYFARRNK